MSIFASETTKTVPFPFDAPHTATIQKLTGRDLERAQAAHMADFISDRRPRGWAALFQRALREGTATSELLTEAQRDPLAGYDRLSLVRFGLKAWTYEKPLTAVDDLDDDALEFLALEVLKLTKPRLFQTEDEAEAATKNG